MEYTNVREFKGGKAEWIAAGLSVETGPAKSVIDTINASTEPHEGAA